MSREQVIDTVLAAKRRQQPNPPPAAAAAFMSGIGAMMRLFAHGLAASWTDDAERIRHLGDESVEVAAALLNALETRDLGSQARATLNDAAALKAVLDRSPGNPRWMAPSDRRESIRQWTEVTRAHMDAATAAVRGDASDNDLLNAVLPAVSDLLAMAEWAERATRTAPPPH